MNLSMLKADKTVKQQLTPSAKKRKNKETFEAYLYLLPSLIIFAVFTFFPALFSMVVSTFRWNLPGKAMFIGLENYIYLFTDAIEAPIFWKSLGNTFYFAVGVPINLIISLVLALLLNRKIRGVGIFRTAFFLPTITSTAAISVVWLWLFHPAQYGLFNSILISLGIPIQSWLRDPLLAMPCLIAMGIWSGMGYNIIIFLAGLQSIPSTYYEAAKIDGANTFSLFRFITWPLLGPTMFYVLTVGIINSLKAFTEIDVMTQGGPLNATNTTAYYLYQNAFQFFQMGKASAIAVLLFLLMLLLTWIQFRFVDRSVHYE
ncbi:MAG TPA: sugar ABC transporter permease [Anaerolineaceae bacterium]|nr:sugar ABC transporter permease [Anaerolineaceae bacterium]HQN04981.1 sugar ABC transporter permease [Anaerolineaceae bacterium]HQP08664.1 sugar ABC transporter permease [Anaerolineaceae bacterium]